MIAINSLAILPNLLISWKIKLNVQDKFIFVKDSLLKRVDPRLGLGFRTVGRLGYKYIITGSSGLRSWNFP